MLTQKFLSVRQPQAVKAQGQHNYLHQQLNRRSYGNIVIAHMGIDVTRSITESLDGTPSRTPFRDSKNTGENSKIEALTQGLVSIPNPCPTPLSLGNSGVGESLAPLQELGSSSRDAHRDYAARNWHAKTPAIGCHPTCIAPDPHRGGLSLAELLEQKVDNQVLTWAQPSLTALLIYPLSALLTENNAKIVLVIFCFIRDQVAGAADSAETPRRPSAQTPPPAPPGEAQGLLRPSERHSPSSVSWAVP
ncbi:hypothetical protein AMECASPLE_025303 [Ameca splendens]|uniref:Uncharacterized protein n=1 Tax=Ameca splendens TaxID=208324 RepID=A0ABV0ZQV2_9TELE